MACIRYESHSLPGPHLQATCSNTPLILQPFHDSRSLTPLQVPPFPEEATSTGFPRPTESDPGAGFRDLLEAAEVIAHAEARETAVLNSYGTAARTGQRPSPEFIALAIAERHAIDAGRASAEARAAAASVASTAAAIAQAGAVAGQKTMVPTAPPRYRFTETMEMQVENGQGGFATQEVWRRYRWLDAAGEQAVQTNWDLPGGQTAAEQTENMAQEQGTQTMEQQGEPMDQEAGIDAAEVMEE